MMIWKKRRASMEEIAEIKKETIGGLRLHFVFNVLNVIRYKIKEKPEEAYDMVYQLAAYFRGCCNNVVGEEPIEFSEELAFAKSYVKLEEGLKERLQVRWEIENVSVELMKLPVQAGFLYRPIEQVLKQEVYNSRQSKTLVIRLEEEEQQIVLDIGECHRKVTITPKK